MYYYAFYFLRILSFLIFLLLAQSGLTQSQRFQVGVIAGLNFSELEGNSITDYFGINTGLIGSVKLRKKTQLSIELLYSQNGEYILPAYYPPIQYGKIKLNYLEIPVHIDWQIAKDDSKGEINWGLSFFKLLNYQIEDQEGIRVTEQILYDQDIGLGIQAGATYFFNDHLGFNFRATYPLDTDLDWTLAGRFVYVL